MSRNNPLLTLTYTAGGIVAPRRILKFGAADNTLVQSAAAGDAHVAVCGALGAGAGEQLDAHHAGAVPVEYGGNVTRGDELTSDGSGRAVTAATTNRVIGVALESGVLGTIGTVNLAPGRKP